MVVLANEGIDDVFIDGVLMKHEYGNEHISKVAAGTHTITYRLANGYAGEAKLYIDGKLQSGMSFTTTGTPVEVDDDGNMVPIVYNLQITGIEKEGYAPASGDGMGMTDYLLIVLVVLIAVMAVLVAIRMHRS